MILLGNCLDVLQTLPEASVHCAVTSPPYWSLRDYGVPPTIWGGDTTCAHQWAEEPRAEAYTSKTKWQHQAVDDSGVRHMPTRSTNPDGWALISQGETCSRCSAWRGCLGLEPTPALYVEHLAEIFDQVHRVLRDDGTLWLNIGDCYAAGRGGAGPAVTGEDTKRSSGQRLGCRSSFRRDRMPRGDVAHKAAPGLKPKDLVGVPWMVAFALRDRGWYLRMDNIWAKTNPMPESIKDRPTKSHEYVFLLSKSESYYFDAEAIREGIAPASVKRIQQPGFDQQKGGPKDYAQRRPDRSSRLALENFAKNSGGGRNRRSVWTIPTQPFPGAHFATFPQRLVEPCIKAGTSEHGCCSICGAPFRRILKFGEPLIDQQRRSGAGVDGAYRGKATKVYAASGAQDPSSVKARVLEGMRERITAGWRPTCRHTLRTLEPCSVLDPFAGTGTAGVVAERLGRAFIGIELNPAYATMRTPVPLAEEHTA